MMFENRVALSKHEPAYFERKGDEWIQTTWGELKDISELFGMALIHDGFRKGDTLSILSANRLIWPVADLGTIGAGGISVGIYPTNSPEQCEYILKHSESKCILIDTQDQLQKILRIKDNLRGLQRIIVREPAAEKHDERIIQWDDFLQQGQAYKEQGGLDEFRRFAHSSRYEDIVIIVYTSGTTGNPKGACLSNRYVLASCESLYHTIEALNESVPENVLQDLADETMVALSFLPYCHVAERISGMYCRMYQGVAGYLVDDIMKLYPYMLEVNPHSFGGLPRFYEKIYAKIMSDVETGQIYDKQEFYRAMEISREVKQLKSEEKPVPDELRNAFDRAEERIYSKVRGNLGSRMLILTSGAAPIPGKVLDLFEHGANLPIFEAYGLTEFVCGAFNTPKAQKPDSVGRPMYGAEIQIAGDGEILFRGPLIFSGYYKDQKATAEAVDAEGWLHTGDIGRLDEDGFLFITGRKKEFVKTSTGKKIAPLFIENLCKKNHLISNVMVYGDNKSYLTLLVTLNSIELEAYAAANNIVYESYAELTKHPDIQKIVDSVIQEVNAKVSGTEQIKKYTILERDFSVHENEITPTGKVKRNVVSEKFRGIIEGMYCQ